MAIKLKLWQKYIASLSTIGVIGGAVIGGLYGYSKTSSSQGFKHLSSESLKVSLKDFQEISKYRITLRDPKSTNTVLGSFTFEQNGPGKIEGIDANQWIENFYREHKESPVMDINAGGVRFTNHYAEMIQPRDFTLFVQWFGKSVAWSPGIASISYYEIKKGVEGGNGSVTLGFYTSINGERKVIKFMPDSFYGLVNFSGMVSKLNSDPITKDEVKQTIRAINTANKNLPEEQKIYPYSVEKNVNGKYNIFASLVGKKLYHMADITYSKHKNVGDIDIQLNDKGEIVASDKLSYKIRSDSKISRLDVLRGFTPKEKWSGIGTMFLKYLSAHEYGHMQTLVNSIDMNNAPISIKPSGNTNPALQASNGAINIDVLNGYLNARMPGIRAVRVSPILQKVDKTTGRKREANGALITNDANLHWGYYTYKNALADAKSAHLKEPNKLNFTSIAYEVYASGTPNLLDINDIFPGENDPTSQNNMLFSHSSNDENFADAKKQIIEDLKKYTEAIAIHNAGGTITRNADGTVTTTPSSGAAVTAKPYLFLMRDVSDLKAFAKFLGISEAAVMFMNSNDNLVPTNNPGFYSDFTRANAGNSPFGMTQNDDGSWDVDALFSMKSQPSETGGIAKKLFTEVEFKSTVPTGDRILIKNHAQNDANTNNRPTLTYGEIFIESPYSKKFYWINYDAMPKTILDEKEEESKNEAEQYIASRATNPSLWTQVKSLYLKQDQLDEVHRMDNSIPSVQATDVESTSIEILEKILAFELKYQKALEDFMQWFNKNLKTVNLQSSNGNEDIHESVDMDAVRESIAPDIGIAGELDEGSKEAYKIFWDQINDFTKTSNAGLEVPPPGMDLNFFNTLKSYIAAGTVPGMFAPIVAQIREIKATTANQAITTGAEFFKVATESLNGYKNLDSQIGISVFNNKRVFSLYSGYEGSQYEDRTYLLRSSPWKVLYQFMRGAELDPQNNWGSHSNHPGFAIFKDEQNTGLLKIVHGTSVVSSNIDYVSKDVNAWKTELASTLAKFGLIDDPVAGYNPTGTKDQNIKEYMDYIDSKAAHPEELLNAYREIITRLYIMNADKIRFNKNRYSYLQDSQIKDFTFDKLLELLFVNIENTEKGTLTNGIDFLYLNKSTLDEYIDTSTSGKVSDEYLNKLRYDLFNNAFKGLQDRVEDKTKYTEKIKLLASLSKRARDTETIRGICANLDIFIKDSNIVPDADIQSHYDMIQQSVINFLKLTWPKDPSDTTTTVGPQTLAAWSEVEGSLYRVFSQPKNEGSFYKIKSFDLSSYPISPWIDNPWEGWASKVGDLFSTYTSVYSELLTRDWVQMTYSQDNSLEGPDALRYATPFAAVTEQTTGVNLLADPTSKMDRQSIIYKMVTNEDYNIYNRMFGIHKLDAILKQQYPQLLRSLVSNQINSQGMIGVIDSLATDLQQSLDNGISSLRGIRRARKHVLFQDQYNEVIKTFSNKIIHGTYQHDRWLRDSYGGPATDPNNPGDETKSWSIYDKNGNPFSYSDDTPGLMPSVPVIDPVTKLFKRDSHGNLILRKAKDRAEAYWWWLLNSYGVGTRTVSSMWRVAEKDGISMWGFLETSLANKVKYIKATSQNGEIKYIPVKTEGTNNLFYLKKQGDLSTKHTLADEGISSWTIDLLTAGTWSDSFLSEGKWTLKFVDINYQDVNDGTGVNALRVGNNVITENDKPLNYAPIILKEEGGVATIDIRSQFAN